MRRSSGRGCCRKGFFDAGYEACGSSPYREMEAISAPRAGIDNTLEKTPGLQDRNRSSKTIFEMGNGDPIFYSDGEGKIEKLSN